VARRQAASSPPSAGTVTCVAGSHILGYWDRAWLEQTIDGLLSLARRLDPRAVHVEVWSDEQGPIIEIACGGEGPPPRRQPGNLAVMTSACEEWTLARWLWQGVARRQQGQVTVLKDANAPRGLRFRLPPSRILLRG
jgi:hypothetical protein